MEYIKKASIVSSISTHRAPAAASPDKCRERIHTDFRDRVAPRLLLIAVIARWGIIAAAVVTSMVMTVMVLAMMAVVRAIICRVIVRMCRMISPINTLASVNYSS